MIQILIAISQLLNACLGGDADEMLSSRAWRCRNESAFWSVVRWWLDNASPLMWWKYPGFTHCESCFAAENGRCLMKCNKIPSPNTEETDACSVPFVQQGATRVDAKYCDKCWRPLVDDGIDIQCYCDLQGETNA